MDLEELKHIIKYLSDILSKTIKFFFNVLRNMHKKFVKRMHFSITFKITTVYAGIFTLILLLLSISILGGFTVYLGKNAEDNMNKDFEMVLFYIKGNTEFSKNNIQKLGNIDGMDITVFDGHKNIIYTTEKDEKTVTFYDKDERWETNNNLIPMNDNFLLVIKNNINFSNGDNIGENFKLNLILNNNVEWNSDNIYIQITNKLSKELFTLEVVAIVLLSINFVFIILTLIVGSRASRKMLKPVDTMTETVKNITINALDTRLDISGSQDELKDLAETFNSMLDRIQESYEQQNQFVSDASHELRTPVSVIQGYANLLDRWGKDDRAVLEESITAIKTESENMKNLIEQLLFLARGDKNTQKVEKKNFYIDELVNEIIKETRLIDKSHEILCDKCECIMVNADRKLIKEAMRAFIDNSVKYTPEGGKIKIGCYYNKSQVAITIEDTGIGIPKEDLPNIFNRFYRADKSRTKNTGGTGLGLAIAKWIVLKHRGTIEVQSKINEGTKVSILLPL